MLLGTPLKNNLGTWGISLSDDENMLGTHWEQGRKTKNNPPNPTPKRKKQGPRLVHDEFWEHTRSVWGAKLG